MSVTHTPNNKETVACNVRVPCKNGQHHYSITQNKIMYLEETVDTKPTEFKYDASKRRQISLKIPNTKECLKIKSDIQLDVNLPLKVTEKSHTASQLSALCCTPCETTRDSCHLEKLNSCTKNKSSYSEAKTVNKNLCDIKTALLIDNLSSFTNKKRGMLMTGQSRILQPNIYSESNLFETRCKSEEFLPVELQGNSQIKFLSVSAPVSFCTQVLAKLDKCSNTNIRRQHLRKQSTSNDKEADERINRAKNENAGKVRNLKMNFEAKTLR